jgi:hypothetical protein
MITEDYVSFEIAKLLKEKGFNEYCRAIRSTSSIGAKGLFYTKSEIKNTEEKKTLGAAIACPTLQMAMKWLREVHNFHIWVEPNHDKEGLYNAHVKVGWWSNNWAGIGYGTHEKAYEAAIEYCLKHLIK